MGKYFIDFKIRRVICVLVSDGFDIKEHFVNLKFRCNFYVNFLVGANFLECLWTDMFGAFRTYSFANTTVFAGGGQLYMWGKIKNSGDDWMYPKPLMDLRFSTAPLSQ